MRSVQKLALIVVFGLTALATILIIYVVDEGNRQDARAAELQEDSIERGVQTFVQQCVSCHGPRGQGSIYGEDWVGASLAADIADGNPDGLTPTDRNQSDDPAVQSQREAIIRDALNNGRGCMPVFAEENGGQLNPEQINELVLMIQHVDWDVAYNEYLEDHDMEYPEADPTLCDAPAAPTAAGPAEADDSEPVTAEGGVVELEGGDIFWSTGNITVAQGDTIALSNIGAAQHNFAVEGYNDEDPVDMPIGGEVVEWTVPDDLAPGDYVFYCDIPGHRSQGMEGTMTVTEPGA